MNKAEEEIANLKASSFHLSVAEENYTRGSVKYRSEDYVKLSLAVAAVERVSKPNPELLTQPKEK